MGFIGAIIVVGMVMGGYILHGGQMRVLVQPEELMVIFGAALGAMVIMAPMPIIKMMFGQVIRAFTGGGAKKKSDYLDLLQMLFRMFQVFRKDGPQAIEKHIEDPTNSDIFKSYPTFLKNHHAVDFLCDTMKITLSADLTQYDVDDLLDQDIRTIHEEEHKAQHIIAATGDSMPGLGIVAAVQGVILTMGHMNEGTEVVGHSVASALVGTFVGVLAAYGFFNPLASKMADDINNEGRYLKVIKAAMVALQKGAPPLVCVEYSRRTIFPIDRPTFDEMDTATREGKKAAA